ncbi:probable fucosyltransferase 7 [Panicum virgatum]|uniref:probable fucosyltransferase 7 n=1 Tax=Panicum virgatum TaxID=38727 RepID=UPI0019D536ED|nr:probable fucosyltransferase 7 [Panicum virgatum]
MDQNKAIRSHLSPCRGLEARRRWYRAAAARPTVLVVAASVAAALLMAGVLFGVRLTPSGGNSTWVSAGVRDVLKAGTHNDGTAGPLATVPDPGDRLLGGLLAPEFDESSCLSRYRAALYRRPSVHAISSHLVSALRRYESLHRRCGPGTPAYARAVERLRAAAAPNASAAAAPSSSSSAAGCSYLVWNPIEGLGNHILTITSGFLYALLTDRVLLLHSSGGALDDLFCEPFPGSTWILEEDESFPILGMGHLTAGHHASLRSVLRRGEDPGGAPWLYVHLRHDYRKVHQDQQFFCDDVQAQLRRVPWLVFQSDNYFVPGLFLVPGLERELQRMFPRRDVVFHHLGRYLFHPSNTVWGMATRYHDEYYAKADERVGIQVRRFRWAPISADELYGQILNCSQREGILPVPAAAATAAGGSNDGGQPAKQKAVLVVSLHGEYSEKLRELYQKNGSAVSVHQPTQLGAQRSGEQQHNQKALAEMVLLSFSDAVVTTAVSTFGYVGQGLAGLRPWVLLTPVDGKAPDTPCRHAATMEPCFHAPPNYDCRARANGDVGRIVRHIRHCEDFPQGVQLVE